MAACVIFWHRANIRRMLDGNENRNAKVMLFKPRESSVDHDAS